MFSKERERGDAVWDANVSEERVSDPAEQIRDVKVSGKREVMEKRMAQMLSVPS